MRLKAELIDADFGGALFHRLSPSFDTRPTGPTVLPPLKNIVCSRQPGAFFTPGEPVEPFTWFDPTTGVGGVGAVSLVAHVLKVDLEEAARRLACFISVSCGGPPEPHSTYHA